jgi:cyclic pyranopterin monophosphate synthase
MSKLDHIDGSGKICMSDLTGKPVKTREAEATGFIHLKPETISLIKENEMEKGEVITLAEISGIQAAKMTSQLVPLVHHVALSQIETKAYLYPNGIEVKSTVKADGKSALEIEALTAVSVALLVLYEMCKSTDSSLVISDIKITRKTRDDVQ